jgi:flagellar assembly factor FliW
VIVKTGRFGDLDIQEDEVIYFPQGILGYVDEKRFCIVDPGDDTLILWLQSLKNPALSFPCLEPKIFKQDYVVRLSQSEMRELRLENLKGASVFSVLTIPEDISQMTANLKAPIVINQQSRTGRQVILQENEYIIQHPVFNELRTHLITVRSQQMKTKVGVTPLKVSALVPTDSLKSL